MTTRRREAAETIREIAADVGVRARVHAQAVRPDPAPPEVAVDDGVSTAIASLYKLPLAAAWADLAHTNALDPRARLLLRSGSRTPGPTGVATLVDDVELSQRDTVRLMLSVSDNTCAEAVLRLVSLERLARWLSEHGLADTTISHGSAGSLRRIIEETGGRSEAEAMARLADPRFDRGTSEYDAALASSSTARELTSILRILWGDERYAWVRESMRRQAWRHRIGSGFPHDDVDVAGKTGTLGRLRHEAAVVHFPQEYPVAVAVLTDSIRPEIHQPRVDNAIGAIARTAVNALRRPVEVGRGAG